MLRLISTLALLVTGVVIGGYLFRDVQPRSFLALDDCRNNCYRPNELVGLLASAGIQRAPSALPFVVRESSGCITIKHPFPSARFHFVVFPKRDVKDIASISNDDGPFVLECFEHIRQLVAQHQLNRYRVETNGPLRQHVTFLHFHVISSDTSQ